MEIKPPFLGRALLLCLWHGAALADGFSVENSGYLSARGLYNESRAADSSQLSALGLFKSRLKWDDDTLALQLRPAASYSDPSRHGTADVNTDALYWEHRFSPVSFIFAGRRKIVNGVALGRNPSDFFNLGKTQDNTLTDEDRRAEIRGDDMAGWSYFGPSYSIQSTLAAPARGSRRARAMAQWNGNLSALASDVSLSAYYADRPGLGLNLSSVIGDKITAYAEAAWRKGRDRQNPVLSATGAVVAVADAERRWIADWVAGGQYTTDSGVSLNAEYWRNGNGFSGAEQAGIANALNTGQGNPPLAGSLLATPGLRKNSVFFRIANLPLSETLKGEITGIHDLDDGSGLVRAAANWEVGKADSLRAGFDRFSGARWSEYGASGIRWRMFVVYKKYLMG